MNSQGRYAKLATCSLNQWAMDFIGNKQRILQSCEEAKRQECSIRIGPELEIPGYGCEDHFLELDTISHSWEILGELLNSPATDDLLCTFAMPVIYNNTLYNCSLVCYNRKISSVQYVVLIRPKMALAENGNYRESRYFTRWVDPKCQNYILPEVLLQKKFISEITGQTSVPIGNAIIETKDTIIGFEVHLFNQTCEELWIPESTHISLVLQGVEIILNSSASHHELRKYKKRLQLLQEATSKQGGVYLYSNQIGCDGGRLYFDGQAMIMQNGQLLKYGSQFTFDEVEVTSALVDLNAVNQHRISNKSFGFQSSFKTQKNTIISLPIKIAKITNFRIIQQLTQEHQYSMDPVLPQFEIGMAGAHWLWDQLRRSGAGGFFLPLSGGADSAATALVVYTMAVQVFKNLSKTLSTLRKITKDPNFTPNSPQDIIQRILCTSYLSTEYNGPLTKELAEQLSTHISSQHTNICISSITAQVQSVLETTFGKKLSFDSPKEDILLQNIQARTRMLISYAIAQLQGLDKGFFLVLGSANLDESLRGYFTKYDCSSGDLNPIGSVSKVDLRLFLQWGEEVLGVPCLKQIREQTPTAELRPGIQADESDMGMSYEELSEYGVLRKINGFGPVSMFKHLLSKWGHRYQVKEIGLKVKKFFVFFSMNRHKQTVITPTLYSDQYCCDDNRYDLRQFLYNLNWEHQFKIIDQIVQSFGVENS